MTRFLKAMRRKLYLVALLEALAFALAANMVVLALTVREALVLALVLPAVVAALYFILRALVGDLRLAWMAERAYPHLAERLVSCVEFGDSREPVVAALREQTAEALADADPSRAVRLNKRRVFVALGAASAFLSASVALFPMRALVLVSALAGKASPLPEGFAFIVPARSVVFEGESAEVVVRSFGVGRGSLVWEGGSAPLPSPRGGRLLLPSLPLGKHRLTVRARRGRFGDARLVVVKSPLVTDFSVLVKPPRYSGLPPQVVEEPSCVGALAGSEFLFRGTVTGADSAVLVLGDVSLPFPLDESGVVLRRSAEASVTLYKGGRARERVRQVAVEISGDAPPLARIDEPVLRVVLPADSRVPLTLSWRDDFGVARGELVVSKGDTAFSVRVPARGTEGGAAGEADFSSVDFLPGDEATVRFVAFDALGQRGESPPLTVFFPSLADVMSMGESAASEAGGESGKLRESMARLNEQVERMSERLKSERKLDWKARRRMSELLKSTAETAKRVSEAAKRSEGQFRRLSEAAQLDPDLQSRLQRVNALFNEFLSDSLKRAMSELKSALRRVDPKAVERALERMKEQGERIEKQLKRLESVLEAYRQELALGRLARDYEKLAAETDKLAEPASARSVVEKADSLRGAVDSLAEELSGSEDSPLADTLRDVSENESRRAYEASAEAAKLGRQGKKSRDAAKSEMKSAAARLSRAQQGLTKGRKARNVAKLRELREGVNFLASEQQRARRGGADASIEAAIKTGIERVLAGLDELASSTMDLQPAAERYLEDAAEQVRRAQELFDMGSPRGVSVPMRRAAQDMNMAELSMMKSEAAMSGGSCSSTGFEGAMKRLMELAKAQSELNEKTGSAAGGAQPGFSLAELAAQQRLIAEKLSGVGEELSEFPGGDKAGEEMAKVVEGMKEVAKKLERGELDERLLAEQQRFLSRMLSFERSANKRGVEEKRRSRAGEAFVPVAPETSADERERRALVRALRELDLSVYPMEYRALIRAYLESLLLP